MFRFFVRFAIASSLVANSFWLVYGITDCSVALVNAVNVDVSSMTKAGAVYKVDKLALVNCEIFEKFLETFREF